MLIFPGLSCVLALGVNISNYLVLGKTSPLTYQVLGHLKTVLILVLGFTVFQVFIQGFLFTFTSVLIHQLILPTETGGFTKCGWYLDRHVGVSILLLQWFSNLVIIMSLVSVQCHWIHRASSSAVGTSLAPNASIVGKVILFFSVPLLDCYSILSLLYAAHAQHRFVTGNVGTVMLFYM